MDQQLAVMSQEAVHARKVIHRAGLSVRSQAFAEGGGTFYALPLALTRNLVSRIHSRTNQLTQRRDLEELVRLHFEARQNQAFL